ncbi:chromatin associated protein KTI12 [Mycena floridula]|nr:chromatin associated protein KTI12 [Mycena floridula]
MALITISGYPCSGKTRRANELKKELETKLQHPSYLGPTLTVSILSDQTVNVHRSVYDNSRAEKPARGALYTALLRHLSQDTIVILDAPNYIKGFRYQMYCAAREMKLRVSTLYIVATQDLCRKWNASRPLEDQYTSETLENLFLRYEEPSSMVRWDSPLFTVTWADATIPSDDIFAAITSGNVKPPNSGTLNAAKAPTDALLTLESVTLAVVTAILSTQSISQGISSGGPIKLAVSSTLNPQITLPARNLSLSELQRLKRQFVTVHKKAITLGTTEKGAVDWSEERIAEKFALYVEENLKS